MPRTSVQHLSVQPKASAKGALESGGPQEQGPGDTPELGAESEAEGEEGDELGEGVEDGDQEEEDEYLSMSE